MGTWALCEISSVGSSWLDAGDALAFPENQETEEDDFLVVDVAIHGQKPEPLTWASRIAAHGPGETPMQRAVAPKLAVRKRQPQVQKGSASDEDDWESGLDLLERRRLKPS